MRATRFLAKVGPIKARELPPKGYKRILTDDFDIRQGAFVVVILFRRDNHVIIASYEGGSIYANVIRITNVILSIANGSSHVAKEGRFATTEVVFESFISQDLIE